MFSLKCHFPNHERFGKLICIISVAGGLQPPQYPSLTPMCITSKIARMHGKKNVGFVKEMVPSSSKNAIKLEQLTPIFQTHVCS